MNPVLLTLTEGSLSGGVEVYTRLLRQTFPALSVIGRETLEKKGMNDSGWPFLNEVQHSKNMNAYLKQFSPRPSLILTNGMHGWALDSSLADIPTVSILHGTFSGLADAAFSKTSPVYWRMRYLYASLEKKSAQKAQVVVTNSAFTQKEVLSRYGIPSRMIEPSIDTRIFSPGSQAKARNELGWNAQRKVVLFVGNPTYSKGFDLIEQVARAHPDIDFQCVTFPQASSTCSNVITSPPQIHERMPLYYRAADALLFPSRYEGFGFVPLEALACNCPVVTSKVGIFHDFVSPAAVVVPHDQGSFADAMKNVLETKRPTKSHLDIASRFSMDSFSKKMKETISSITKRGRV